MNLRTMKKMILMLGLLGIMMPAAFAQTQNNQKVKDDSVKVKVKDSERREKAKVKTEDANGVKDKTKVKDKKNDTLPPKVTPRLSDTGTMGTMR